MQIIQCINHARIIIKWVVNYIESNVTAFILNYACLYIRGCVKNKYYYGELVFG